MNLSQDKPCLKGHTSGRRKSGNCIQCERERYQDPKRQEYVKAKQAERRAAIKADPEKFAAQKEYMRQYVKDNREKLNAQTSERYFKDPRKRFIQRLRRLGVVIEEWLLQHLLSHDGLCDLCRKPGDGRWKELSIDHCHNTNQFRGMLCTDCNTGIGKLKDDPALLRRAADYVEHYQ